MDNRQAQTPPQDAPVIDQAKRLQRVYEDYAYHKHRLLARRSWASLPENCRQEFISITRAVLNGDRTYHGDPIPQWVIDTINQKVRT